MTTVKTKVCFISAPYGVNISPFVKYLNSIGFRCITPNDYNAVGISFIDNIKSYISESDLLIFILDNNYPLEEIYFELGIANSFNKRIVIITSGHFRIPSSLENHHYIIVDLNDINGIRYAIKKALTAEHLDNNTSIIHKRRLGTIRRIRLRNSHTGTDLTEKQVYNIIKNILINNKIMFIEEHNKINAFADFSIWVDDLDSILGNPILIDVKNSIRDIGKLHDYVYRLRDMLNKSIAKSIIVIYNKISNYLIRDIPAIPNILFINVNEFISAKKTEKFADIVLDIRNKTAHGSDI